jgi:hypothetical protein
MAIVPLLFFIWHAYIVSIRVAGRPQEAIFAQKAPVRHGIDLCRND